MSTNRLKTVWGEWEVLSEDSFFKVKKITVNPGHRLSYQTHKYREEFWTIVQGKATITLEGVITEYESGGMIHIPIGAAHRIANSCEESVIFIEVQRGSYFGEDDIIRLEDDYGRS